jgi:hypothetical protein
MTCSCNNIHGCIIIYRSETIAAADSRRQVSCLFTMHF